jgi:hypothetical protein
MLFLVYDVPAQDQGEAMSMLIETKLGQFRAWTDGKVKSFLFQCPDCGEMLPMSEEVLAGIMTINHESRSRPGHKCTYSGTRDFGKTLISAMQAQILMGYKPYHDEGQDQWQPLSDGSSEKVKP